MDYVGDIFRPPSEAGSLILQVTVGCSHNRCTFCGMYAKKNFRIKPLATVLGDLDECSPYASQIHKVFLCDGDALVLSTSHLVEVLSGIRERLPLVRRVSCYGDAKTILSKTPQEWKELRELGLSLVYEGAESGDEVTLTRIGKRSSRAEMVAGAARLRDAGVRHSVMFLLGVAGVERSAAHALASAELLTAMSPDFAAALTLTLVPGTPLELDEREGRFALPEKLALLEELKVLIENSFPERTLFSANHASNYLPIQGWLPREREKLVALVEEVLRGGDESVLTPEWARGL